MTRWFLPARNLKALVDGVAQQVAARTDLPETILAPADARPATAPVASGGADLAAGATAHVGRQAAGTDLWERLDAPGTAPLTTGLER